MMRYGLLFLIPLLLLAQPDTGLAQDDFYTRPRIDARGDYLTNAGPVSGGTVYRMAQAGALWRVVSPGLNCRAQADPKAPSLRWFRRGTLLQANLGMGGADEVLYNAKDARGYTWMWVRSRKGQDLNCYVRANRHFIRPLMK